VTTEDPDAPPTGGQLPYGIPPQQPSYGQQQTPYFPPPQQEQPGYFAGPQHDQHPTSQYPWQQAGWLPPMPPQKSHQTRNIILSIIGTLVVIIVIGVVVGLLVSGRPTPAASTTNQPPTASASSPAGTLTVDIWYTTDVQPTVTKLQADLSRVSTDASNDNGSALLADCQQTLTDVQAAQADPQVADPTLASDWTKVLADFSAGANDCIGAVHNNGDVSLVDRSRSEIEQGNTDAGKLATDIEKLVKGS
jgi:hypothetical protein